MSSWGWRIPFFSGFLFCLVGVYLRSYLPEHDADTPQNDDAQTFLVEERVELGHLTESAYNGLVSFAYEKVILLELAT